MGINPNEQDISIYFDVKSTPSYDANDYNGGSYNPENVGTLGFQLMDENTHN